MNRFKILVVVTIFVASSTALMAGTSTGAFGSWWSSVEGILDDPDLKSVYTSGLIGFGAYKWGSGGGMPAAAPYLAIAILANQLTSIVNGIVTATI